MAPQARTSVKHSAFCNTHFHNQSPNYPRGCDLWVPSQARGQEMCFTAKYCARGGGGKKEKGTNTPQRHFRDTGINNGGSCERVQLQGGGYLLIFTVIPLPPPSPAHISVSPTPSRHQHPSCAQIKNKRKRVHRTALITWTCYLRPYSHRNSVHGV